MKKKLSKAKAILKEYKDVILVGTACTATAALVAAWWYTSFKNTPSLSSKICSDIPIPDALKQIGFVEFWTENEHVNGIVELVDISKLGEFGKALVESGYSEINGTVNMIIGLPKLR